MRAGVVRVAGLRADELANALDPLPAAGPVPIWYRPVPGNAAAVLDDVLTHLETIACQLFPAWLPDAQPLDSSDLDRRAVRLMARRRAAVSQHYGPYLADLADAAVTGRAVRADHGTDVRARGLLQVLCDAYDRDGVALIVGPVRDAGVDDDACATALRWLTGIAGFDVWLLDGALPSVDRFPTVGVAGWNGPPPPAQPAAEFPPLAGRPHPASAAEQALERALARFGWAHGRVWNQEYRLDPLARAMRIDLMWPQLRCAVEIDGPEHRGAAKYADDRRRDNTLVMAGFVVLRFTNEDIADDVSRAVGMIEELLSARRREGESA